MYDDGDKLNDKLKQRVSALAGGAAVRVEPPRKPYDGIAISITPAENTPAAIGQVRAVLKQISMLAGKRHTRFHPPANLSDIEVGGAAIHLNLDESLRFLKAQRDSTSKVTTVIPPDLRPYTDIASFDSADGNFKLIVRARRDEAKSATDGARQESTPAPSTSYACFLKPNGQARTMFNEETEAFAATDGSYLIRGNFSDGKDPRKDLLGALEYAETEFSAKFPVKQVLESVAAHARKSPSVQVG